MSKFWSPFVKDLVPYVPGEQPKLAKLVKLNTNENPYGPSPKAIAAMQAELNDNLRLYPDPNSDRLKQAVADYYGVQTAQVFVGNGSDEVLAHAFHGLFQHGQPLLFPDVTYSFYPVYCGLYGIPYEAIELDKQFQIRVEDYARPNGGIIFPNPNAPTGCPLGLDAIERVPCGGIVTLLLRGLRRVQCLEHGRVDGLLGHAWHGRSTEHHEQQPTVHGQLLSRRK